MRLKIILSSILIICFLSSNAISATLFTTDFEGDDWTHTQPTSAPQTCISDCGISNGFQGYYDGFSYCTSAGNNNFYMDAGAGHPGTTTSCHGGSKCLTYWTERCTPYFEDSDGNIGVWFTPSDEVYITFYARWDTGYVFNDGGQEKMGHVQWNINDGSHSPWSYFSGSTYNFPSFIPGLYRYEDTVYMYLAPRCAGGDDDVRCNAHTPSYCPTYGNCDYELAALGTTAQVFDGNWHKITYRLKNNTGSTGNFNADGIFQFWWDDELKHTQSNVPWNTSSSGYEKRSFNFFSIGGNNLIPTTSPSNAEHWWAVDDICVATDDNGCTGGGDTTAPTVTGFTIPETGSSLTQTITTFTCTDDTAVTGYCVNESASAPSSSTCSGSGWAASAQTAYTFATEGAKTLYAWCKDAAGNISDSASDTTTITLPTGSGAITIGTGNGSMTKGTGNGRGTFQQ